MARRRYFTATIDLLLLYGGDVEKFAGDCMIVVFAPTPQEAQGAQRLARARAPPLALALRCAAACGQRLLCLMVHGTLRPSCVRLPTVRTSCLPTCPAPPAGSDDGGLAAATLRAVTCGSELATRFGE